MSLLCERDTNHNTETESVIAEWRNGDMQVFGPRTRRYLEVFEEFDRGNKKLDRKSLLQAFSHMKIFPTRSQIYSMLMCSSECLQRDGDDFITFGDFCVFTSDLEEHYDKFSALNHSSEIPNATDPRYRHNATHHPRSSSSMPKFKVFLGGSCNPTTWRKDIAIPLLKDYNLTYYNPQVENWSHELIAIEDEAKEVAELLLFVIDSSTRSVASLVEAAYLSGAGRPLVLVMKGLPTVVENETISDNELKDLRHSHAFLCDMVERQWCPIFEDVKISLHCAAKALHRGLHLSQLTLEDGAQPVKHPAFKVGDKLRHIREVFDEFDRDNRSRISLSNAFLAIRAVTGKDLAFPAYNQIVASCAETGDKTDLDFNEFCCLVTEYKHYQPPPSSKGAFSRLVSSIYRWLSTFKTSSIPRKVVEVQTDVFLGGTCLDTTWREEIAIPCLARHDLTFFNPKVSNWNMSNIAIEARAKDTSLYLLFVISATSRGIASMIEVAHYIGQGRKVVLCIQQMEHGVCVYGETLTERAIRDYNRARSYLADIAKRRGVPVYENIQETIDVLVEKLKMEHEGSVDD
ncbi:uncharacterized protein LOC110978441 isoform X2 [Acanthaster planci]|uniref:Uncharacterized protein LOC110978441 isoform X2 n=1 Tax=Acanthaster planci TaxID=133434 RepID=A0A8B7Y7E6_ACAPL|nr:uncharacterized protein LOC110978441 isoform X2 [Acanthaster planci]